MPVKSVAKEFREPYARRPGCRLFRTVTRWPSDRETRRRRGLLA